MSENDRKEHDISLAAGSHLGSQNGGNKAREHSSPAESGHPAEYGETPQEASPAATASSKAKNEAWEWVKALLIAFVLAFLIRYFLFGSYIVDGPSMKPNFHTGERLIVNKILYDIRTPKRGEVVVFHATPDKDFIKRVIALPGETVRVQGDEVYINGEPLDEPYLRQVVEQAKLAGKPYNDLNWSESTVPEGSVFVMGDNRSDSTDSRMIGPVPFDNIVGRAEIVFWPIADMQRIH